MWKAEEQAWLAPYYRSCKHRPASTTRPANVPRSTTSARFSPPSSIRIIADWKNKLRRGSQQFEETGTPVTKSSAKWTVRLSPACWRICHLPVSERMARRCVVGEEACVRACVRSRESLTANHSTPQECLGLSTSNYCWNITFSHHLCMDKHLSYDTYKRYNWLSLCESI